jgi:hypothetical protein
MEMHFTAQWRKGSAELAVVLSGPLRLRAFAVKCIFHLWKLTKTSYNH